jgi:hypothetical protein
MVHPTDNSLSRKRQRNLSIQQGQRMSISVAKADIADFREDKRRRIIGEEPHQPVRRSARLLAQSCEGREQTRQHTPTEVSYPVSCVI